MELLGRVGIQLAAFIVAGSVVMVAVTHTGSAEHVISIVALTVGVLAMAIAIFLFRLSRQTDSPQEE